MEDRNNTAKKKYRFNFIDAIVILVILAAVGFIIYLTSPAQKSVSPANDDVSVEYNVEIKNVLEEFKGEQYIKPGDIVSDSVEHAKIGEVVSVQYSQSKLENGDADGNLVLSDYPNHMDVTITIKAKATRNTGFYSINGYNVMIGKEMDVRVPNFAGRGFCTEFKEVIGKEVESNG